MDEVLDGRDFGNAAIKGSLSALVSDVYRENDSIVSGMNLVDFPLKFTSKWHQASIHLIKSPRKQKFTRNS